MLEEHVGKQALLMCGGYHYWGVIEAVSLESVKLSNAHIVFETGDYNRGTDWQDAQRLPIQPFFVRRGAIESYGVVEK